MTFRLRRALAVSTIVASAGLFGATAYAQQQTQPAAQQANPPASSEPGSQTATPPSGVEQTPNFSAERGFQGRALARLSQMSPQDRAALLDARLAGLKAGLELTADQDKLWTPLEQTVRDGVNKAIEMRQQYAGRQQAADPMERLHRLSEMASARADFLHRFVDSAQPLYASLTPDQKRRLPMLMQEMGGAGGGLGMHGNGRQGMMGGQMRERMQEQMRGESGQRMGQGMGQGMRGHGGGAGMREDSQERRGWGRQGDWRRGDRDGWRRGDQDGDRRGGRGPG